jgi:hypothetical protein
MTFNGRSKSGEEEQDEHDEEESSEVDEDLANLVRALETGGDVASCEQTIARNFLDFSESPVLNSLPSTVLFDILSNCEVTFPYAEKISRFFVNLFDRGEDTVRLFMDLIPYDELSFTTCEELAAKLEALGRVLEGRRVRRVGLLYSRIEAPLNPPNAEVTKLEEELERSSQLLERVTGLLGQMSHALRKATEELEKQEEELKERDEQIGTIKGRKRGKR